MNTVNITEEPTTVEVDNRTVVQITEITNTIEKNGETTVQVVNVDNTIEVSLPAIVEVVDEIIEVVSVGIQGPPGPNIISAVTATDLTGLLTGDGSNVGSIPLTTYVPYLGAVSDVDLGVHNFDTLGTVTASVLSNTAGDITINATELAMGDHPITNLGYIDFNLVNGIAAAEARMVWNDEEGGVNVGMKGGNVNLQVGQEVLFRAINKTGSTIVNGTPVYVSGSQGGSLTIAPADADFDLGIAFRTIGVATEDIDDNMHGYVTSFGRVRDIDTRAYDAGDPLYLAVGGGFSTSPPTSPNVTFIMGIVEKIGELDGEILISQTSVPNLASLSDVTIASAADNDLLQWNVGTGTWVNVNGTGTGAIGYWSRTGTVLSPVNAGDNIETTGDISATFFSSTNGFSTSSGTGRFGGGIIDSGSQQIIKTEGENQLIGGTNTSYEGSVFCDWGEGIINDSGEIISIDAENRGLHDSLGKLRFNYNDGKIYVDNAGGNTLSIDTDFRQVFAIDGTSAIFDWKVAGKADFLNNLIETGGDIRIDTNTGLFKSGSGTNYTFGWNGTNAVHTILSGEFRFIGGTIVATKVTTELSATSNLADGVTAVTQTALDNSTKVATTEYVDDAVLVEDLWDRADGVLSPKNVGDDIETTGDITGGLFKIVGGTTWKSIVDSGDSDKFKFQEVVEAETDVKAFIDGVSVGNLDNSAAWQEISGITISQKDANNGHLWGQSDGSVDLLLAIDSSDASNQGEWTLSGINGVDYEDISSATVAAQPYVYLGDIGNNGNGTNSRGAGIDLIIYRIKEPTITGSNDTVSAGDIEKIDCVYPGGDTPSHRDAETLMVDPATGDMYIITKREAIPGVYKLAHSASYVGIQTLTFEGEMFDIPDVSSVSAGGNAVGGDISPDGTEILVKSYDVVYLFSRNVGSQTIIQALQGTPTELPSYVGGGDSVYRTSPPTQEPQGEAICFSEDGEDYYTASEYVASEGSTAARFPLFFYERLAITPTEVSFQDGVAPTAGYAGTEDTYVWDASPTTVYGTDATFVVDVNPSDDREGLLKFDISGIPAGATIVGARVDLNVDTEGQGWTFHRVLNSDWDEADSYNSIPNGPPAADNVFASSVEDNRNGVTLNGYTGTTRNNVRIDTIQAWVDGIQANYGWLLLATDPADGQQFSSRQNGTANLNPRLTVRYTMPVAPVADVFEVEPSTQILTFTKFPLTPPAPPVSDYEVANKKYVDDEILANHIPAGSDTQIQYNDNGAFGADANFTWDLETFTISAASPKIQITATGGSGADAFVRYGDSGENYSYAMGIDDSSNTFRLSYNGSSHVGAVLGTNDFIIVYNNGDVEILGTTLLHALDMEGGDIFDAGSITAATFTDSNLIISSGSISNGDDLAFDTGEFALGLEVVNLAFGSGSVNGDTIRSSTGIIDFGNDEPTGVKFKITALGGYAIKITNKTGVNSVAGDLVIADILVDDAVDLVAANGDQVIGVFLDSGVADGSEAWVVISGIADVNFDNNAVTNGDRIIVSTTTAGKGTPNNSPSIAVHFTEIGHSIESVAALGTGRCVLHFN